MNIRSAIHKENNWTVFLDRDGVINKRPGDGYVTHPSAFHWLPGSLQAVASLKNFFSRIIIVTNQQGIGKGLMTTEQLNSVHKKMLNDVREAGGKIDAIYYAQGLQYIDSFNRKPSEGMFLQAKSAFPGIDNAIMVGDTFSDMMFGHRLHLHTALISRSGVNRGNYRHLIDYRFNDLAGFTHFLTQK